MKKSGRTILLIIAIATTFVFATHPASKAHEEDIESRSAEYATAVVEALGRIDTDDISQHIGVLADDSFEGREAGTRGGRAAGNYILEYLAEYDVLPAGDNNGFVQQFGNGYRNILGVIEGSDPDLKNEFIVIGAHYDHVGYGNASNSFGPTGRIHNGADDNASGTSGLLEIIQGLSQLEPRPKRSILVAFWDAEEKGLLGSIHWVGRPTVDRSMIRLMINIDMIGRLRNETLEVYGTRTAAGNRRLAVDANVDRLKLAFNWDLNEDSDHHPFFRANIPVIMYHTGLHGQYHRPTDDPNTVDEEGLRQVAQLTMRTAILAADREMPLEFRTASRRESDRDRTQFEQTRTTRRRGRLGANVIDRQAADNAYIVVGAIETASPASTAQLQRGDRIVAVNGRTIQTSAQFEREIWRSPSRCVLSVATADNADELATVEVDLRDSPIRIGLTWLSDEADPSIAFITEVIANSPADDAGLVPGDRILQVDSEKFTDSKSLLALLQAAETSVELVLERDGRLDFVTLNLE